MEKCDGQVFALVWGSLMVLRCEENKTEIFSQHSAQARADETLFLYRIKQNNEMGIIIVPLFPLNYAVSSVSK